MGEGFLNRLQRRGPKGSKLATDIVIGSIDHDSHSQETQILSSDSPLGSADDLLRELAAEGEAMRSKGSAPKASAPDSAVRSLEVRSAEAVREERKDQASLFDEALPWWLTDPAPSSPQVDLLVPAARLALNELITEKVRRDELPTLIRQAVGIAINRLSSEVRFSGKDVQDGVHELTSLMIGKGPLQALYDDPLITDVYLDGYNKIKCIRRGQALETPFRFRSPNEYEAYITTMLQSVDRVLNLSAPIVDCVLDDPWRSRINAVHSSLLDGQESALVVRIPRLQQVSFYDLLRTKTLPATLAAWLAEVVSCGEANIMVLGPTGSGKTTLTTALLTGVGSDERIITIEDVPEIFVSTAHLEKLVSRPENAQGEGSIGMEKLLRAALRRAPHRIVVGEIRDREGPLFLKALETGHAGSIATIHAENPRDGLWRLLDVVAAHEASPQESIQRRIARSVHLMISLKKVNGRPCLTEVAEVMAPRNGDFEVRTLVAFDGERHGKRQWKITCTQSEWLDRMVRRGVELVPGPGLTLAEDAIQLVSRGEPR